MAIEYNKKSQHEGYVLYEVKANTYTVKDMAYASANGWKLLLQFIANHDSMIEQVKMIVPENDNLPLLVDEPRLDRKSTRLNSSHVAISYAVFCLKKKMKVTHAQ